MERVVLFLAALVPTLLVLEYGVAKTRGSWANEALWTAFLVGAVGALGVLFVELGLAYVLGVDNLPPFLRAGLKAFLIAAAPEEAVKFFVLVAVAERHVDARRYQDIVVLALAVGLGFAALENLLYLVLPGDWRLLAAMRALTAVPSHGIDGLVMGALLTFARLGSGRRDVLLTLSLAAPVGLHAAYDFPLMAIEPGRSTNVILWAAWIVILVLSAAIALVLCRRAIRKAAEADRLTGRDVRPADRPLPLIATGSALLGASLGVAVTLLYWKDVKPPWLGVIIGILPAALSLDLIGGGISSFWSKAASGRSGRDPEWPEGPPAGIRP